MLGRPGTSLGMWRVVHMVDSKGIAELHLLLLRWHLVYITHQLHKSYTEGGMVLAITRVGFTERSCDGTPETQVFNAAT